ncbi:MAG: hypothetical protein IKJ89_09025 [Kiritimatiellae bacterium]|nr:hypothetical protein [Kiritimatiellia bacterium]
MADGTYERRGPREAELKHLQRLIDEQRGKTTPKPDGQSASQQDKLKSARVVS